MHTYKPDAALYIMHGALTDVNATAPAQRPGEFRYLGRFALVLRPTHALPFPPLTLPFLPLPSRVPATHAARATDDAVKLDGAPPLGRGCISDTMRRDVPMDPA